MTKFDEMLELEEKVNNAAKECSDRLWNKKWNPGQDMLATAFIEGAKWLARESMKEQANDKGEKTDKPVRYGTCKQCKNYELLGSRLCRECQDTLTAIHFKER